MKYLIMLLFIVLAGCNPVDKEYGIDPSMAPEEYTFTEEQFEKIKAETEWCVEHTSYSNIYCYGTAIMRRGTLKARGK